MPETFIWFVVEINSHVTGTREYIYQILHERRRQKGKTMLRSRVKNCSIGMFYIFQVSEDPDKNNYWPDY